MTQAQTTSRTNMPPPLSLSAVAVIGANGGIGAALVENLAQEQIRVFACMRHTAGFTPGETDSGSNPVSCGDAEGHPWQIVPVEVDPADEYSVCQAIMNMAQETPALDAIVYCSGDIQVARISEMNLTAWHRMLAANLTGPFLIAKHGIPLLQKGGSLIYIGAQSERLRLPGMAGYVAAKSGLENFVAALAKEERGINISLVRPGAVDTAFWNKVPLQLPRNALSADHVAQEIIALLRFPAAGTVDL